MLDYGSGGNFLEVAQTLLEQMDGHAIGDELEIVLVGGVDVDPITRVLSEARNGAREVIRLDAVLFVEGDAEGFDEFPRRPELGAEFLRGRFSVCFVRGEFLFPEGLGIRVKS